MAFYVLPCSLVGVVADFYCTGHLKGLVCRGRVLRLKHQGGAMTKQEGIREGIENLLATFTGEGDFTTELLDNLDKNGLF